MNRARRERRLMRAEAEAATAGSRGSALWELQRERARNGMCPWCGARDEYGLSPMRDAGSGLAVCWGCYLRRGVEDVLGLASCEASKAARGPVPQGAFIQSLALAVRMSVGKPQKWPACAARPWCTSGALPVLPVALAQRDSTGLVAVGLGFLARPNGRPSPSLVKEALPEVWPVLKPVPVMLEGGYVVIPGTRRHAVEKNLRQRLRDWADAEACLPGLVTTPPLEKVRIKAPKEAWVRWIGPHWVDRRQGTAAEAS